MSDRGIGFWDLRDECSDTENVCVMNISEHQCWLPSTINISRANFYNISFFKNNAVSCVAYVLNLLEISEDIIPKMNHVRPKSLRVKNIFMK